MYIANEHRYEHPGFYRRCGRSGLMLPALSLGLWHNFGNITPFGQQQNILRAATVKPNGISAFTWTGTGIRTGMS